MAVFISYSSRDKVLLEKVVKALRQAHEQVWFDEELSGGEAWWRKILEQIRDCEVFIAALSKNSLDSKPCVAEVQYAQALGKPILPVHIGPMVSMRLNPLAAMQIIDYQNPTIETSIELISNVHARRATLQPLPDPLPEEPPMPFAYLMRLATTLAGPQLTPQQQTVLLSELKAGLEEDGDDEAARRDIGQLFRMLRDRPDVTWRIRTEVEKVLASLESSPTAAAPVATVKPATVGGAAAVPPSRVDNPPPAVRPQPFSGYQPPMGRPPTYGPRPVGRPPNVTPPKTGGAGPGGPSPRAPAGKPRQTRKTWIVAGGVLAAVVVAVGVVAAMVAGNSAQPPPPPPSAPVVEDSDLAGILLTGPEVHAIMGTQNIYPGEVFTHLDEPPEGSANPSCAALLGTAIRPLYEGSGYTAVRDQGIFSHPPEVVTVIQSAVGFTTADEAIAFRNGLVDKWKACVNETVTFSDDVGNATLGDVTEGDSQIEQVITEAAAVCQHVLRTVSNAIVEVYACNTDISDEASRIAAEMAAKVTG